MLSIDHIVIMVSDLGKASADYASLGFTVVPGGEHADRLTHNALVAFEDGSYLELIAFLGPPAEQHSFYRPHGQEGLVTFALLPEDINEVVSSARSRSLDLRGPLPGGRQRPDGLDIAWQTAWPATHDLPFLCADVTPRDLRVPFGPARLQANGVTGIARVTVLVSDLQTSALRYQALLGTQAERGPEPKSAQFQVGDAVILLVEPEPGLLLDYLVLRGEGPYSLSFRAREGVAGGVLDPALTHGTMLEIS